MAKGACGPQSRGVALSYQNLEQRQCQYQTENSCLPAQSPATLSRTPSMASLLMDCEPEEAGAVPMCSSFDTRSSSLSSSCSDLTASQSEYNSRLSFSRLRNKYSAELMLSELSPRAQLLSEEQPAPPRQAPLLPRRTNGKRAERLQAHRERAASTAGASRGATIMVRPLLVRDSNRMPQRPQMFRDRRDSTPSCLTPTSAETSVRRLSARMLA
ncbi:hypothetical protein FVE85_6890 [Porphyridium purpureum]|uniref:Uncharacterized protein n=1 Tax=Porphyridium purpureum TaxID=35688 RepID=A0A5J4Z7I8_PORPP|nr:hypothetical protein FVE85_6890 [Porphyridium purpureum]|eukprot:POR1337..scf295_1